MKRWRADGDPDEEVIAAIAEILLRGGVALLPTDTIYGLHAVATDAAAVARVAALKGRGEEKPFAIIAASADQLRALGADVPPILETIWPAPLTAILPRAPRGDTTVAARVPDVAWLRRLLTRSGPLVSTSANRAGEPPISAIDELANDLLDGVDAALDAGPRAGEPSTIVDFTGTSPKIVREGAQRFAQELWKTLRIKL